MAYIPYLLFSCSLSLSVYLSLSISLFHSLSLTHSLALWESCICCCGRCRCLSSSGTLCREDQHTQLPLLHSSSAFSPPPPPPPALPSHIPLSLLHGSAPDWDGLRKNTPANRTRTGQPPEEAKEQREPDRTLAVLIVSAPPSCSIPSASSTSPEPRPDRGYFFPTV